jgi:hypothetical protein
MPGKEFLAIMQPYYFPSPSHFSLYYACSEWVIFDLPQFKKKSFMSRNYFQSPDERLSSISIQLFNVNSKSRVHEIQLENPSQTRDVLLANIQKHKKVSKQTNDVANLVADIFDSTGNSLVDLNEQILLKVAKYIGFERKTVRASSIAGSENWAVSASEWAPLISASRGMENYLNPSGGRSFLKNAAFEEFKVNLFFHEYEGAKIPSHFANKVIPDLSIINHLLRWEAVEVREQLTRYSISSL